VALSFNGTDDYAKSGTVFNNDTQLSIFCRLYIPSSYSGSQYDRLFELGGNATDDGGLSLEIDSPSSQMHLFVWEGSSGGSAGSYSYPTDTWFDFLCTSESSAPSNVLYWNGGSGSETTVYARKTNATELTIAGQNNAPTSNNSEISVADFTIWHGVILTQEDSDSLAEGVSPLLTHPENIRENYGLVGGSGNGKFGVDDLNVSGAAKTDHPRVFLPSAQILQFPPAPAVGGATSKLVVLSRHRGR